MIDMVLNMPRTLNMPAYWLSGGSEYTRVLNMRLILSMSEFWTYHGSKYVRSTESFEYA